MIPLGDASRRALHFSIATALLIAVNTLVFLMELADGDTFVNHWPLVPVDIMGGRNWVTTLTAMFMDAGWAHIPGNMLFFWVFGPEIEDVMGAFCITYPCYRIRTILFIVAFEEEKYAVQADKFHIWSVASIQEGIEVLTGVPAGRNDDGTFASEGVFMRVDPRLTQIAEELTKFASK